MKSLPSIMCCSFFILLVSTKSFAQFPLEENFVCVRANNIELLIQELKQTGDFIQRFADGDEVCTKHPYAKGGKAFSFNYGLGNWAVGTLRKSKFVQTVHPAYRPAGGTPEKELIFNKGTIFANQLTPESLRDARADTECRLNNRLKKNFYQPKLGICEGEKEEALCFSFTVYGHSGDTKISGFNRRFGNITGIGRKYWISVEGLIIVAPSISYFTRKESEKIIVYVSDATMATGSVGSELPEQFQSPEELRIRNVINEYAISLAVVSVAEVLSPALEKCAH